MRKTVSTAAASTTLRLCIAILLAGTAAGCSSDVSRFGGLFSNSDNITTNSIPGRNVAGAIPIPARDVSGGQQVAAAGALVADPSRMREQALNQPFPDPVAQNASYDPVSTASTPMSGARLASTPISVQRQTLSDPTVTATATPTTTAIEQPLAQPFPTARSTTAAVETVNPDPLTTGRTKGGWTTANAPSVMMRQGDSVAVLSKRFGVPEKEILRANNLKSASDAEPGQRIIIPTFGVAGSAAKASASDAAASLDLDKQRPVPVPTTGRDVAILPGQQQQRDKNKKQNDLAAAAPVATETGAGGTYTVKSGDSLSKVAKRTGVSIDALKQANGLTSASLRIGQTLKVPKGGTVVADQVTTASVPQTVVGDKTKTKSDRPQSYTPPVAKATNTQTVNEVASVDPEEASPKSTGIGKYRWPVRGQVIAAYGANVDGNRNDGINISVPEGTPIKAAENGVVIYSGSSLKELGNAVLVRHDDGKVTVYGNASNLKVQRGDKVQRGQTIAASGMTGKATQPQVHFEVRKDATAVNPAAFLE